MLKLKSMIQPLNNQILVAVEKKPDKTKSGVIIASQDDPRSEKAKVISVDREVKSVKKGDIVYFKSYSLSEIEKDGKLYGFLKEEDILGKEV